MATVAAPNPIFKRLHDHRGLLFPVAMILLLGVLLVPLPTFLMDLLLVLNIGLSIMILVTALHVRGPLDFAVFPSLLLAVTLARLVLNVATTRLILTAGERFDTTEAARHGAGEVVLRFAEFVAGGSLAVGAVIFVIIFLIQFVVITKGATRISEVAARFTLDAMPGRQMAIDADLNAGHIDETEARRQRDRVSQEADFYGAMDGASKFVRGDAVAGIAISAVNVLGGLYVGLVENGWSLMPSLKLYTMLTIGDGLVTQVPAFIVSLAAGLIVTRSSSRSDLGNEVIGQLFDNPRSLAIAAGFLGLLAFSGLPPFPLLLLAGSLGGLAWLLGHNQARAAEAKLTAEQEQSAIPEPESVERLLDLESMELEVGYGLVRLVDTTKGGDLLDRIELLRREVAGELGIIVPPIRIRDVIRLTANDYVVKIRGQSVARGVAYPEQFLAMDSGSATGPVPGGTITADPTFGLPAYWITESEKASAESLRYDVIEAAAVLSTHLGEVIRSHAHELLSRQEVRNLVDNLRARAPAAVDEVIPSQLRLGELQKVMQNLLRERVPVRDLETIIETLGDHAPITRDPLQLTERVRVALARPICKQYTDEQDRLWCVTLDPELELMVEDHLQGVEPGSSGTLPPRQSRDLLHRVAECLAELTRNGRPAVVLCGPGVRMAMRRIVEPSMPHAAVIAYNEIVPEVGIEAVSMVSMTEPVDGQGDGQAGGRVSEPDHDTVLERFEGEVHEVAGARAGRERAR